MPGPGSDGEGGLPDELPTNTADRLRKCPFYTHRSGFWLRGVFRRLLWAAMMNRSVQHGTGAREGAYNDRCRGKRVPAATSAIPDNRALCPTDGTDGYYSRSEWPSQFVRNLCLKRRRCARLRRAG